MKKEKILSMMFVQCTDCKMREACSSLRGFDCYDCDFGLVCTMTGEFENEYGGKCLKYEKVANEIAEMHTCPAMEEALNQISIDKCLCCGSDINLERKVTTEFDIIKGTYYVETTDATCPTCVATLHLEL